MSWHEAEPIGSLISRLRKSRGKSQQDLAEMLCAASSDWDGRLEDAVELARDGRRYEADGTISARLLSLEARACGALGDVRGTQEALGAAERAREQFHVDGEDPGGVFTFSAAKQAAYAGTALLALGQPDLVPLAIQESTRAIGLYEAEGPDNRSPNDLLAARLDLASAHLTRYALEGMNQELLTVLAAPPRQRSASIVKRVGNLGRRLVDSRYEGFSPATFRISSRGGILVCR